LTSEMYHPFLVGQKVYLRGVERQDLDTNYFQWLNDAEVTRFMHHGRFPNTMEGMVGFHESTLNSQSQINLAVITRDQDRHIGNIALNAIDWVNRTADVGILIGEKDSWGKGVAGEALELLEGYAFDRLNIRRLTADTQATNVPGIILLKKLGWVQEGRKRQQVMRENEFHDMIIFGLLRGEYYEFRRGTKTGEVRPEGHGSQE
jgi:ribosomal-protein-alanine N-acetyltransferase